VEVDDNERHERCNPWDSSDYFRKRENRNKLIA
jgi:hypothetical protein